MNYRHAYHAGNFADLLKHLVLIFCLEKLSEKPTPFFVLDTHSGKGKYDLDDENFSKTFEAEAGIKKIIKTLKQDKQLLPAKFLEILAKTNCCKIEELESKLRFYPGSPLIIKNFIRGNDRAVLNELNREEFSALKPNFAGNKKFLLHREDGFNLVKSKLPPIEKRGVILIDPAFEKDQSKISADYDNTALALKEAHKRFAHGVYIIWYPIIKGEEKILEKFYHDISKSGFEKITKIILDLDANTTANAMLQKKMNCCGCLIINAPWQLEEKMNFYLNKITPILKQPLT